MNVARRTQEIAKCFVGGLQTDVFREEMNSHIFETLENIIREDREELSAHRDILKKSDRIKKVEPKRNFRNPGKIFRQRVQILKGNESTFPAGASPGLQKMGCPIPMSTTSKIWSVLGVTKRDIMLIITPNLKQMM